MTKKLPPSHLSAAAKRLWAAVRQTHVLDDADGLALLRVACEAFDRAESARTLIDQTGPCVLDRFGQLRAHPAVQIERDARSQIIAAFRALRLSPPEV